MPIASQGWRPAGTDWQTAHWDLKKKEPGQSQGRSPASKEDELTHLADHPAEDSVRQNKAPGLRQGPERGEVCETIH